MTTLEARGPDIPGGHRPEERCLSRSGDKRAKELREAHLQRVAHNESRVSPLWARHWRAYNVHIQLARRSQASLGQIQKSLKREEPNLLVCPEQTLHVSVAWLLVVHASYSVSKDVLWERHGQEWRTELSRIAAQSAAFRISYDHVVATDSAVVALAEPTGPVNRIRRMIQDRFRLPPETRNEADLVHTTLFRFGGTLHDPARFLAALENTRVEVAVEVEDLVVSKELVYPSLQTEVLERLPLGRNIWPNFA